MEDLTQSQIHESCRLALPEGLKELMNDISREVLRYQPRNLYEFIANYLSALMVSREHLTIAGRLCSNVSTGACFRELDDELRDIGFTEDEAVNAKEIVIDYLNSGGKNKTSLMNKLLNVVKIDERQLGNVRQAIRNAFQRHMVNNTTIYESSSESELDEVDIAAKHTLKIYRKTRLSNAEYQRATDKVQASYRAYGVKRNKEESLDELESPPKTDRSIRFGNKAQSIGTGLRLKNLSRISSSSLAGSYLNLPKYVPYSAHSSIEKLEELPEMENITFDYTQDFDEKIQERLEEKKISFQKPVAIEDLAAFVDDESEATVEEITIYDLNDNEELETVMNEDLSVPKK